MQTCILIIIRNYISDIVLDIYCNINYNKIVTLG